MCLRKGFIQFSDIFHYFDILFHDSGFLGCPTVCPLQELCVCAQILSPLSIILRKKKKKASGKRLSQLFAQSVVIHFNIGILGCCLGGLPSLEETRL